MWTIVSLFRDWIHHDGWILGDLIFCLYFIYLNLIFKPAELVQEVQATRRFSHVFR